MSLDIALQHNLGQVNAVFGVGADALVTEKFLKGVRIAAKILRDEVRRGYSGAGRDGWAPLHSFTIREKGHDEPLFHTGAMMDSVEIYEDIEGISVGINDPVHAMKARIQERGATIPVSPKMRAFLLSRGFPLRASTQYLVIPARPNFANSLREVLPQIGPIIQRAIDEHYSGVASGTSNVNIGRGTGLGAA